MQVLRKKIDCRIEKNRSQEPVALTLSMENSLRSAAPPPFVTIYYDPRDDYDRTIWDPGPTSPGQTVSRTPRERGLAMTGAFQFPRVQAIPEVDRVSLRIDGVERAAYHHGNGFHAPFLFPIVGPSGAMLTRLGPPAPSDGRPDRSVWIGHANLAGNDYWSEQTGTDVKIRHRGISRFEDGAVGGVTVRLDWWANGQAVLFQTLDLVLTPTQDRGFTLDLASRFETPGAPVEFGQSDLGFLGVRIAKTMSEGLGGGRAISSEGRSGASAISGTKSRWVDYSGPSAPNVVEGICILDHPSNPTHPTAWHVEADGLIAPAFNATSPYGVAVDHALDLRYRLVVHAGSANPSAFDKAWEDFAQSVSPDPASRAYRRLIG
jgi:hypothetical protein